MSPQRNLGAGAPKLPLAAKPAPSISETSPKLSRT